MKTIFSDQSWWEELSPEWKQAFSETFFRHENIPAPEEIEQLFRAPALRFAGPSSPYPNMSFELTNLSGLRQLENLEVLVVIFHQIESMEELKSLTRLKSLFLYNNQLKSLSGIESLPNIRQLYVQCNALESVQELKSLVDLKELYIHDNKITSLEGITENHADSLDQFFCMPNKNLKKKDLVIFENSTGIRCRSL